MPDRRRIKRIADIATVRDGAISRRDLLAEGMTRSAVAWWLGNGRLCPLHLGVYALGHVERSPLFAANAALLACGPDAVLSHRSAAALWRLIDGWPEQVEVTAPGRHRRPGVLAHQTRSLPPSQVTRHRDLPVTTPARTLLDLAESLPEHELVRAVNEAQVLRVVTADDLVSTLIGAHGRHGAPRLRAIVAPGDAPTESVLEDLAVAWLERYDVPRPERNQWIAGKRVDMLWRAERVIVELDGRTFHDHPQAFERDRERDAELAARGWIVIRITWRRLKHEPAEEARRLKRILERRRPS